MDFMQLQPEAEGEKEEGDEEGEGKDKARMLTFTMARAVYSTLAQRCLRSTHHGQTLVVFVHRLLGGYSPVIELTAPAQERHSKT